MDESVINIIAIISYNNKNYCIYQTKGNIGYAILCNREFNFNVDNKDVEILNKFYNIIRYDNNYGIFCGNYNIKSNEFEIYQDIRSNLYTFVLKKNNKRYIPSEEDTILLNSYFNNQQFIYYEKNNNIDKKDKNFKFIRKVLKIGAITAISLISATILTYNLPQNVKSDIKYEIDSSLSGDLTQKSKDYTFEDLKKAIAGNHNIPEEEKKFIEEVLEAEFEENKEYMDIEVIMRRLSNLRIKYDKYYTYNENTGKYQLTHGDNISKKWSAYYNIVTNEITCLQPENSDDKEQKDEPYGFNEVYKSTYYHEINHVLTNFGIDSVLNQMAIYSELIQYNDYVKINSGILKNIFNDIQRNFDDNIFTETINEILSQEYVDKYYKRTHDENRFISYNSKLPYMFCLIEILSPDVLREYKFNDNESIITQGLLDISDNKQEVYRLMTSLKSIYLYETLIEQAEKNNNTDEHIKNGIQSEEIQQLKEQQAENFKRIRSGYEYFYKAKYNKSMSNDINMLIYLYNTPLITDEERQKVKDYLNIPEEVQEIKFYAKGYFAKDYIEKYPDIGVIYMDRDSNEQIIHVDVNHRYIENKSTAER